ncbi:MAG: hypothetical protein KGL39_03255 [Patescibacteria group bacterium]|nr:hypothetical protein [Patescibacteria group bacterium]
MPYQPDVRDVHIDAALTNFSIAYMQDAGNFVAADVFPIVPVDHKSDKYFTFAKDTFMRRGGRVSSFGQEAPRGGLNVSNDNYSTETWRWAFDLLPDVRANADPAVNMDQVGSNFVMNGLLVEREIQWGTKFFTTGVWATDDIGGTGFAQWDDPANSDPITDISNARKTILSSTGFLPNTLTVGFSVHEALKRHPLIVDRFKYTSSDSITAQMLARLFEVDRYLVCKSVQATNQEGEAITTAFILGNHALLSYAAPAPSLMAHSAGYTFVWSRLTGINNLGVATFRYPMPHLGVTAEGTVERIEGQYAYTHKVTGSDLGYFFSNATAS